ncbi:MAG: universal stress protein [Planctomycetes bacterium]|nr:universal stress protein [Planctomycetota bacterium]
MAKSTRKVSKPKASKPAAKAKSAASKQVRLKTVLCSTDLTACGQQALAIAAELAQAHDAKLLVAHFVQGVDERYDFLAGDLARRLAKEAKEKVQAELAHLHKARAVPVEVIIKKGQPATETLKLIKARKVDLVCIGSHGRGLIDRLILGSVAEQVLRLSPVSVLVAPPTVASHDMIHLLCAVDGSTCATTGLEWAIDLARREESKDITVVNAYEVPVGYLEAGMSYESARDKIRAIHQQDLDKTLKKAAVPDIRFDPVIEEGPVAETIIKVAKDRKRDLIIIGTHGRSRLAAFFIGGVALQIVRDSPLPVLCVKSEEHKIGLLGLLGSL